MRACVNVCVCVGGGGRLCGRFFVFVFFLLLTGLANVRSCSSHPLAESICVFRGGRVSGPADRSHGPTFRQLTPKPKHARD